MDFNDLTHPWVIGVLIVLGIVVLNSTSKRKFESLKQRGIYPPHGGGSESDIERLIQEKQKIYAIKLYRELHGGGLKEAKEAVEAKEIQMRNEGKMR